MGYFEQKSLTSKIDFEQRVFGYFYSKHLFLNQKICWIIECAKTEGTPGPWYFPSVHVCIEWPTWQCPNQSCKCHKWLDCPPKRHNHNVRELCACTGLHCTVQQWLWTPKVNKEDKKCKKKAFIPSIIQVIEQGEVLYNVAL